MANVMLMLIPRLLLLPSSAPPLLLLDISPPTPQGGTNGGLTTPAGDVQCRSSRASSPATCRSRVFTELLVRRTTMVPPRDDCLILAV